MRDNDIGRKIYNFCGKLFPICRSLTGEGVRTTLRIIDEYIYTNTNNHLNFIEIPSGTDVFDWTIPEEWIIRSAYIEDEYGNRIVDIKDNNLHIMGYSAPVDRWLDFEEAYSHIFVQEDQDEVIPYVTSYYKKQFGFCMSRKQRDSLRRCKYHFFIDSEFKEGSLTEADLIIRGNSDKEILLTTYICHPSMANDICSGMALLTELICYVSSIKDRNYTYRFVFEPETIGAIAYINSHLETLKKHTIAAFNLTCVGDNRDYSMIETIDANSYSDRVLRNALRGRNAHEYSFLQRASDERQYGAPGVDIPMVSFCRSKFGEFREYHTSADNMDFVSADGFQGSYEVMRTVIDTIENNNLYKSNIVCEAQLGKRGLYPTISQKGKYNDVQVYCDIQAYANGKRDLLEMSDLFGISVKDLRVAANILEHNGIISAIKRVSGPWKDI